jgi:hypothetical protein
LRELIVKLGLLEYNLESNNITMKEAFAGLHYLHNAYVQGLVESHVKRVASGALLEDKQLNRKKREEEEYNSVIHVLHKVNKVDETKQQ